MAWALTKTSPNRCLNSSHTQFVPMVIEIQSNGQVGVASPDVVHMMRPGVLQMAALPPLALYVHIPWCLR